MPEGERRCPEVSKALAQLYITTIQYPRYLEASGGFALFSKAKSRPLRMKARNVSNQSPHLSSSPNPSIDPKGFT